MPILHAALTAMPVPRDTRARRRVAVRRPTGGYLLIESLTALALLTIGMLPLATLAPVALGALRHHEDIGHATRAAAELAELEDPRLALSPLHARGIGAHHLQLCRSLAPAGAEHGLPGCAPGRRLAVVGPLPRSAGPDDEAALRAVALWIRP